MKRRARERRSVRRSPGWAWRVCVALVSVSVVPAPWSGAAEVQTRTGHPRLIVLDTELPDVRERLAKANATNLLARVRHLSMYEGFQRREGIKEAGHQAAGFAVLHALTGDAGAASAARERVQRRVLGFPLNSTLSLLERSCRLIGAAMAYDLCWRTWSEAERDAIGKGIEAQGSALLDHLRGGDRGMDETSRAIGYSAAGMSALAVLGDPCCSTNVPVTLDTCAREVTRYLRNGITAQGIAIEGEGPKQMALLSGVLPFCLAYRNAFGRLPDGGERIEAALMATALQTVPGAGAFRFGTGGTAADRSGIFSVGVLLAQEKGRAHGALIWLSQRMLPEDDCDVTRPFQALCAVAADVFSWRSAKIETGTLPLALADADSGFHCVRSSWSGSNDVVVAVHAHGPKGATSRDQSGGELHIVGMGGRWATSPAIGSAYGLPSIAEMPNVSGFVGSRDREVACTSEGVAFREEGGGIYTVEVVKTGAVAQAADGTDERRPSSVPFRILRHVLIDFSGVCGSQALVAVLDRVEEPAGMPKVWALNTEMPMPQIEKALAEVDAQYSHAAAAIEADLKERKITQKEYDAKRAEMEHVYGSRAGATRGYMYWHGEFHRLEFGRHPGTEKGPVFDKTFDLGTPGTASMRVSFLGDPERSVLRGLYNPPRWKMLTIENAASVFAVMTLQRGDAPAVQFVRDGGNASASVGRRVLRSDGKRLTFAER